MSSSFETNTAPDTETDPRARGSAKQAIWLVLAVMALLVVCAGDSVRNQGEELDDGIVKDVVLAVGHPTGWIADNLPFAPIADELTGWVSSDDDLGAKDGTFSTLPAGTGGEVGAVSARIPPDAFENPRSDLKSLLVTGDSMSQPLDAVLARRTAGTGVLTKRDAKVGTGISKTDLVDWGKLSVQQIQRTPKPDAVIMFLGANEGFSMPIGGKEVACCSPDWIAEYATRVRAIVGAYRAGGAKRVYWLTLPAPREAARAQITGRVNDAIRVATAGFGAQVQLVDASALFSPGFKYRDAMPVDGRDRIVRDPDGIHLNDRGAEVLADTLMARLKADFTF